MIDKEFEIAVLKDRVSNLDIDNKYFRAQIQHINNYSLGALQKRISDLEVRVMVHERMGTSTEKESYDQRGTQQRRNDKKLIQRIIQIERQERRNQQAESSRNREEIAWASEESVEASTRKDQRDQANKSVENEEEKEKIGVFTDKIRACLFYMLAANCGIFAMILMFVYLAGTKIGFSYPSFAFGSSVIIILILIYSWNAWKLHAANQEMIDYARRAQKS